MGIPDRKKVLLVYVGGEQDAWGAIAFQKPRHFYVMPGILYCAAVLREHRLTRDLCDTRCLYLNATVQSVDEMLAAITEEAPDVLGFSTFCWNVTQVLALAAAYRAASPEGIVLLGGPEISMKDASESSAFFAKAPEVDGLVFGESEEKLPAIVHGLLCGWPAAAAGVQGFALASRFGGFADHDPAPRTDLSNVPSPFPFDIAVKRSPECGLAMVYETGRGCPYRCVYCRFSHRDNSLRGFDPARVERELEWLLSSGFDCIHVADAVFDLDPARAKRIVRHIIERNVRTSLFFYCSFQKLDEELAALFGRLQCQIGVGVQSTNPETLRSIRRGLNPSLFDGIRGLLETHRINFYTDLIFGLPPDSMASFERSFDDCVSLAPSFVMLFPLTLIKGTPLEEDADGYGMIRYGREELERLGLKSDIEYRNVALHRNFSLEDLRRFDDVALACFYYYNRFRYCLDHLRRRCPTEGAAQLYGRIGAETKEFLDRKGRKATNTSRIPGLEDEVRRIFCGILADRGAGPVEMRAFDELLKVDLYRIIILDAPQRERVFASTMAMLGGGRVADLDPGPGDHRFVVSTYGKKIGLPFALRDLLRLAELGEGVPARPETVYVHAPFDRWDVGVRPLTPLEGALLERIPSDRPVRRASLLSTAARVVGTTEDVGDALDRGLCDLRDDGIVTFVC